MEPSTVADIARPHARRSPDRIALDDGRRRLTSSQLDAWADALACGLVASGVRKGDVVGWSLPAGIASAASVLAVARAGALLCPLNPRYKPGELAPLLQQARPRVVLAGEGTCGVLRSAGEQAGVEFPLLLLDASSDLPPWARESAPLPVVRDDDPFTLLFTSGTTGKPKGAVATHGSRMAWIRSAPAVYGIDADDRFLSAMPQSHSAGLTFTLIHLHAGATVRVLDRFDAQRVLQAAREEGITSLLAVPTMLRRLLDALPPDAPPLEGLRRLITCGSPLPPQVRDEAMQRLSPNLYDYYGCTESSSITVLRPNEQRAKAGSVGRAYPGVHVQIVDGEGRPCAPGAVGEVWCDNPSTMRGYFNDEQASSRAFTGRWYRTGDLGHLDDDGYLFITGRSGDMVISGGINIHPAEVEQVLQQHPSIAEVAVAGVPDPVWGQALKAYVVLREGAALSLEEIQRHCTQHLADFKKPRAVRFLDALPRNAAGKVVRGELEGR